MGSFAALQTICPFPRAAAAAAAKTASTTKTTGSFCKKSFLRGSIPPSFGALQNSSCLWPVKGASVPRPAHPAPFAQPASIARCFSFSLCAAAALCLSVSHKANGFGRQRRPRVKHKKGPHENRIPPQPTRALPSSALALTNLEALKAARRFHRTLPGYRPTPLVSLRGLAGKLGATQILVKDESPALV